VPLSDFSAFYSVERFSKHRERGEVADKYEVFILKQAGNFMKNKLFDYLFFAIILILLLLLAVTARA
jgi:hypothetical protein